MKELERHVDSLFADYRQTRETKELKEEILSNLEAKTADYIQEGMTREDAVKKAVESIKTVDYLIDGSRKIYFNRYVVEMFRSLLIYILIAWIVTIPMRVISSSIMINNLLTCAAVILGVIYFTLAARKDSVYLNEQRSFDTKKIVRFRILVWIVWVLFILGATLYTTAIRFGSNIWFGYRIRIDGPYRLAEILLDYILPFITLIIPLMFNRAKALIEKCGVKELP